MKKLFLIVFILISVQSFSQLVQYPTNYGVIYRRGGADTILQVPSDTFTVPAQLISKSHIAIKNGTLYRWNGSAWVGLSGGSTDTTSLSNRINLKLNISDTATMLTNYVNGVGYALLKSGQVIRADSATLANYFLRRKDSATGTNLNGYLTRTSVNDYAPKNRFGVEDNTIPNPRDITMDGGSFAWNGLPVRSDTSQIYLMTLNRDNNEMGYYPYGSTGGGSGISVDTIYRTPGKDSIQFIINGVYHAIKDSVGSSGLPSVGNQGTILQVSNGAAAWKYDTTTLVTFTAGARLAGDTTLFTDSTLYGSFYLDGNDTLIITKIRAVMNGGSSDTLGLKISFNDTINVDGTRVKTADIAVNSTSTGNETTSFDNPKIPPGNWVWMKTPTVVAGRKPQYFSVSIIGYKKRVN